MADSQAPYGIQKANPQGMGVFKHKLNPKTIHDVPLSDELPDITSDRMNCDNAVPLVQNTVSLDWLIQGDISNWPQADGPVHFERHTSFQARPSSIKISPATLEDHHIHLMGSPMKQFELLSAPVRERELINHWVTNLAHKLIPMRDPTNPFLTIVSPMTLEGSRIARSGSTCTVALYHAVCAISAAHLANIRGHPSDDGLMVHHKQLSYYHLMQNMNCEGHNEQMASLATLCLWILIHFVTGTPGAWREVIKVTRELLERVTMETWKESNTAALTYQSFASSIILIQAQYLGRQEYPSCLTAKSLSLGPSQSQIMPTRSLELVSSFNTRLLKGSPIPSDELDQFELEFTLSTPEPSTDLDIGNADSVVMHHHRSLFYYACILYFRCNSGKRGPEHEIQNLVSRCLDHMEHIDLLQKDNNPKTWIYATVAFEAATPELRDRLRLLFARRKLVGIATWDTLYLAVEEIWNRRDAALPGVIPEPWTRVLREMPDFDVVMF
ncbi:hypothetical protein HJFPF1_11054 [Paramyrothecium foliicola]|nr:hypothetical protein HJFPF1_11054 [Paramyrothecium foliicola]